MGKNVSDFVLILGAIIPLINLFQLIHSWAVGINLLRDSCKNSQQMLIKMLERQDDIQERLTRLEGRIYRERVIDDPH